jgi:branched-chain amino acid aminotransferase
MKRVWLDGGLKERRDAAISIDDRGFTLADGLFETVRTEGARALWLDDHLARLRAGAAVIGLAPPCDDAAIRHAVDALLHEPDAPAEGALRLTLTRGPAAMRGLWDASATAAPTLLLTLAPRAAGGPAALVVAETTRRNERSPLSACKTLAYGDNLLARREALARGATDALLLNTRDRVACTTVGNVFLRIGGRWVTPAEGEGLLPGLARQRLVALLGAQVRPVERQELAGADAAFVCNSLSCTPVERLEGRTLAGAVDLGRLASIYGEADATADVDVDGAAVAVAAAVAAAAAAAAAAADALAVAVAAATALEGPPSMPMQVSP